jgi:hypothetical protein
MGDWLKHRYIPRNVARKVVGTVLGCLALLALWWIVG